MRARRCLVETTCVLVAFNLARAFGLLGPALFADAVLLVAVALVAGLERATWTDVGLRRDALRAGLAWGFGAFGLVFLVLLVTALLPVTNGFLHDTRAAIPGGAMLHELFVSILIGTVVPEELAFRGVLLGAALHLCGRWRAVLLTSAMFGLWHVAPTLHTMSDNPSVRHAPVATVVLGAVTVTFVAGVVFCWLRLRSGSLVAPALAHLATNGLGLAFAWIATH